jgi:hypothetical protein
MQTMSKHASPGPPHLASAPACLPETSHPDSWWNCRFAQPNNFCKNHSGKLICMLVLLTRVLIWLQFGVITEFSGQMLTFDGHWHAGEVCSSQINPGFSSAPGRFTLVRQGVPVPPTIQQLHKAIEKEWDNSPQATINIMISVQRRCVALHETNGGHTRY